MGERASTLSVKYWKARSMSSIEMLWVTGFSENLRRRNITNESSARLNQGALHATAEQQGSVTRRGHAAL